MADITGKSSRSYRTDHDKSGHEFDEDPLVELARIVSEDGSFIQTAPAKPENLPESGIKPDPFSADLEAELMEQFDASFASKAADRAGAAESGPEIQSEPSGYTASDSQALRALAGAGDTQSEDVLATLYERSGDYDTAPADDRTGDFGSAGQAENDLLSGPPVDPPSGLPGGPLADLPGSPATETAGEPARDPYRVAPDDAIAGTVAGEPHSDAFEREFADALGDPALPPLKEDFTPEFGAEADRHNPEFHNRQASGDGPIADEPDYQAPHYTGPAAEGEADDVYDGEAAMPPPAATRTGGRKGLIAVAGVLAVVILGGGVAAYISKSTPNDPTTPAPVIKAEAGDIKVMADATDSTELAPSVLDQLTGQQAKLEEKLIDRIEEPQQIARIILPGPDSEGTIQIRKPLGDQAEKSSGTATDVIAKTIERVIQEPVQPAAAPKYDPIGPRKVRTIVVKPDGTFVSNDGASALVPPSLPATPDIPTLPPLETMKVASVDSMQSPKPTPVKTMDILSIPVLGESVALSGSGDATDGQDPTPQATQNTEPLAPVTDTMVAGDAMAAGDAMDETDAMQAMVAPTGAIPRPKPADKPDTVVARAPSGQDIRSTARSTKEPVNLLAAPAETDQPRVTASTAPATKRYVVQVSSQRSADQARSTFASMQRRYKSILGGFKPNIERADLGAKGTYYRVRIGPMANREAALRLCQQLKSAGGNCFVTR